MPSKFEEARQEYLLQVALQEAMTTHDKLHELIPTAIRLLDETPDSIRRPIIENIIKESLHQNVQKLGEMGKPG